VKHPFDVHVDGGPPFAMVEPYWTPYRDWEMAFADVSAPLRAHLRTLSQWFDAIDAAGFVMERVFEPQESESPKAEGDDLSDDWLAMLPYTIVFKARKR